MHVHNRCGFDAWNNLKNIGCERRIVDLIKTGGEINSLKVFSVYIKTSGNKTLQQYVIFKCGLTHLNLSLRKSGTTFEFQKGLVKTEMKHEDVFDNTWKNKKDECIDYVKSDVLCTVFSYTRYSKALELFTLFGREDCSNLLGLGWKIFKSFTGEEDEPIYTYIDRHMRRFVR